MATLLCLIECLSHLLTGFENTAIRQTERTDMTNICAPTASPSQDVRTENREGFTSRTSPVIQCNDAYGMPNSQHPEVASSSMIAVKAPESTSGALARDSSTAGSEEALTQRESSIVRLENLNLWVSSEAHRELSTEPTVPASGDGRRGGDAIKKAVSDYVVQLLSPLYKTRKINKDDFKAIVKKSTAKVRKAMFQL